MNSESVQFLTRSGFGDGAERSEQPGISEHHRRNTYAYTAHQLHGRMDGQTDKQTDGRLAVVIPRNAYSASRGKSCLRGRHLIDM